MNLTEHEQYDISALLGDLPICGCGNSDRMRELILGLLARAEDHENNGSFYENEWIEFGAHSLDHAGFLEHGTGIGAAWLTDKGKAVLWFLRVFGVDDNKWPHLISMGAVGDGKYSGKAESAVSFLKQRGVID